MIVKLDGHPQDRHESTFRRSLTIHAHDVVRYTQMPRGGHFAAIEETELLVHDITEFARSVVRG